MPVPVSPFHVTFRLSPFLSVFPPYAETELHRILKRRALFGLRPGSYSDGMLKHIAHIAEGNARIAIQILWNAALNADCDSSETIMLRHVKSGHNESKELKKSFLLDRLNSHQRLLYELVKERKEINSGELWKVYLERCRELQKPPIAVRTYSEYMNRLIEMELVRWDRALVRGKVRVFTACD